MKTKTKNVRNLIAQQRERHSVLRKKRDALSIAMKQITATSNRAISLLVDLHNASEEFVSFGAMVCSKVQHAVSVCDPDSLAVAGSVVAIEVAKSSVAHTASDQHLLQNAIISMTDICESIHNHQDSVCQDLAAMHEAHMCAADAHSLALLAIEQGHGSTLHKALHCVSCDGNAEAVYAARTGMCKKCHDATICESRTGWVQCTEA